MLKPHEAALFLAASKTEQYRTDCIDYWRKLHGVKYANEVKRELQKLRIKKNG
jgi:hypothetical protein